MKDDLQKSRSSTGAVRSEASHQAIIEAARTLLSEKGYAGFSIDGVARMAGASKPTIYRWWANKAQLIAEVYEVESARAIHIPEEMAVSQRFSLLLTTLWELWNNTPCGVAFRSFIAESQNNKKNMELLRDQFMQRRFALPREILETAVRRKELPADTDIEMMLVMSFGFCWFHLLTDNLEKTEAIAPFVQHLFTAVPRKLRDGTETAP
ncbi:TetR/AcrR family transcriptional regulator [Cronobacter turicensis]|uniref:TetR/AcrR family transcriptional regulator n=1 Tax=Cronobacter turicensis TaxID=413502 RepID=UPI000CFE3490|nr:TetR/AcrR family transcriptional regulator [Cronobacter turicensis]ELY4607907.1 TetR/AcrR family transcriptional regulator [Cronobacter turicensis]